MFVDSEVPVHKFSSVPVHGNHQYSKGINYYNTRSFGLCVSVIPKRQNTCQQM